jgi:hypothetical protein
MSSRRGGGEGGPIERAFIVTNDFHVVQQARLFAIGILLLLTDYRAAALLVDDYTAAANNLYASGFSGQSHAPDPVLNTNSSFIGAGLDWSGVGWVSGGDSEGTQGVTLIDPQHFLFATHYPPAGGSTVSFTNRQGQVKTYSIASLQSTTFNGSGADVSVGTLTAPIPASDLITYYPILSPPSESDYLNLPLLVYGKTAFVGRNTISGFVDSDGSDNPTGRDFYMINTDSLYQAQGESGDSGSPSFVVLGGTLALVGIHSGIQTTGTTFDGTNKTFDQFIPYYVNQINTIVSAQGYSVTTVQLPGSCTPSGVKRGARRQRFSHQFPEHCGTHISDGVDRRSFRQFLGHAHGQYRWNRRDNSGHRHQRAGTGAEVLPGNRPAVNPL